MRHAEAATISQSAPICGQADDPEYNQFVARINDRFQQLTATAIPLFTTDVDNLFDTYLAAFPDEERQHYNCNACRRFINTYGGLVTIDETGATNPAIWHYEDAPAKYQKPIFNVINKVLKAKVNGVFLSSEKQWGTPVTGDWHHYAVKPWPHTVFSHPLLTAGQMMAEKREDFKMVIGALASYPLTAARKALTLLNSETLYRAEKVIGPAKWFVALHNARESTLAAKFKTALVWRAVATAPVGFCHIRSSMIGTLLDDIMSGMEHKDYAARFADKMDPLKYQRPQAAPKAGNIEQAERIIAALGVAESLERRYARIDEIKALWKPKAPAQNHATGVFDHLKKPANAVKALDIPPVKMSWEKFERTILHSAATIELMVPVTGPLTAMTTATNADAPPILQWDKPDNRNPLAWYTYGNMPYAADWALTPNRMTPVLAVSRQPNEWGEGRFPQQGEGIFFILEGAKDKGRPGACLFPEMLVSSLHAIRQTIEAHSKHLTMGDAEGQLATGWRITKGRDFTPVVLRVQDADGNAFRYKIDRWD